jgi:hypothetical protein
MAGVNLEPIDEGDLDLEKKFHKDGAPNGPLSQEIEEVAPREPEKKQEKEEKSGEDGYERILSKIKNPEDKNDTPLAEKDISAYPKTGDAESQVQHLVDLAQTKGVFYAVKMAKHHYGNFELDKLHGSLNQLHDELVKRGLIREF